jgi:hypothetical protein
MSLVQVVEGHLAVPDAARPLGISFRHLRRLLAKVRQDGPAALAHGNRGRTSPRRLTEAIRTRVLTLPRKIAELVLKVYPHGLPLAQERRAVYVTPIDVSIVDVATRLVECLAQPGDAELLAPLGVDKILIRLLCGPLDVRVAQLGLAESSVHRVAKAISWLRPNFSSP